MLESSSCHKKTKNSKQNAEGCKDCGIYQNF